MSADRQTLLRQRLASVGLKGTTPANTVARRKLHERACLSFAQEHTFKYQRAHPRSVSNNLGLQFEFTGNVDETALVNAIQRIAQRHEILRTTYHADAKGCFFQRIHDRLSLPVSQEQMAPEDVDTYIRKSLGQLFDLTLDAPIRVLLLRTGPQKLIMGLIIHHIIWDGATFDILSREIEQAYADPTAALPELTLQYGDIADWQRNHQQQTLSLDRKYWHKRLAEPRPQNTLSDDPSFSEYEKEVGGRVDHRLQSSAVLTRLAAQNRVTPFIVFMACWATVLGNGRSREVSLGTTVMTRDHGGSENLIGNFANHIALQLSLGEGPQSSRLIAATAQEFDSAFSHRHLSFEEVATLNGCYDITLPPALFDTLVVFIPSGTEGPRLPDVRTRWKRLHNGATQFPLVPLGLEVFVRGRGDQIAVDVEATYACNRFAAETVKNLLLHLDQTILDASQKLW